MPVAVALLSAAILACEVLLMRLFSITHWHHYAGMVISVALLGFGASGTVLALGRERLLRRPRRWFGLAAGGFLVTAPVGTALALRIPLHPFQIIWQWEYAGALVAIYGLLLLPFTCGALAIGLALAQARETGRVGRVYAANLVGSGLGAVLGLGLCYLPWPAGLSEFKPLFVARAMGRTETVATRAHPLGRMEVVQCPSFRAVPGLSLNYRGGFPRQDVMFVDGDGGSAVNRDPWTAPETEYLDWLPNAAAYQVRAAHRVLVLGAGGGADLQQALRAGARDVVGVELHPAVAGVARAAVPEATVIVAEARTFLRRAHPPFDVIQFSLSDSVAAGALSTANENFLLTVEALTDAVRRLTPDGMLSLTRRVRVPPRDTIRLFATAVAALERGGVTNPAAHVVLLRGWATGTVLVKRSPFTPAELDRLRAWAKTRLFDTDYFPGATSADVNQLNVLSAPGHFEAAQAILGPGRAAFYRAFPFNVRPTTDAQPFFSHFFRWRAVRYTLDKILNDRTRITEWGYLLLVVTLAQAVAASVLLVGVPVGWHTWRHAPGPVVPVLVYFGALGLGFMLLEMVWLQRLGLLLGSPLYAATLVVATLLVAAGGGAAWSRRWSRGAFGPALVVAGLAVASSGVLPALFAVVGGAALWVRWLVGLAWLVPVGVVMGVLFPLGLARTDSNLVPLAWAVNGCAAVLGATLAGLLAMDWGFDVVTGIAAGCYLVAGVSGRWLAVANTSRLARGETCVRVRP